MKRAAGAALLAAALATAAAPARANGKFPASGQIVVDPGDPQRIIVRTTFGILVSTDGGERFGWICEDAAGYGGGYDPGIAVAAGGAILAGVPDGLSVGQASGCAWARAAGAVDKTFVADVSVQQGHPELAIALSRGAADVSAVFRSTDGGATWVKAGVDLPSGFHGSTLDVAPSDAARLYVGGVRDISGIYRGAVARSKDGGGAWEVFDLPASEGARTPYLAAVDPSDAALLYARLDGTPGKLLVSKDAGESWAVALTLPGFLKAFALSPDGAVVLAGGPSDGLWRAPAATLAFQKVSSIRATCLSFAGERVYACSDEALVSRSSDMGSSFTPLLRLPCVTGPLACGPSTSVGAACPAMWGPIAQQIGAMSCAASDAGADAPPGSAGATGGEPAQVAAASSGGAGTGTHPPPSAGACGCRAGAGDASPLYLLGLLGLLGVLGLPARISARAAARARASGRARRG